MTDYRSLAAQEPGAALSGLVLGGLGDDARNFLAGAAAHLLEIGQLPQRLLVDLQLSDRLVFILGHCRAPCWLATASAIAVPVSQDQQVDGKLTPRRDAPGDS